MFDTYVSPLNERYASKEMQALFSPSKKFRTWRKLWIALARAEKELGLEITDQQISELEEFKDEINFDVANEREKEVRHDVMAHIYAYGQQCPTAKPIIHLGATSCYVGDNADLLIMEEALRLIRTKLLSVIKKLSEFAMEYRSMPTLGFTHLQAAQLTTVGKRACLWIQDLTLDLEEMDFFLENFRLLGCKGTTGTQASFVELFDGDLEKVKKLDEIIAQELGFPNVFPVSGQTYPRKIDSKIMNILSGIAQSASKFSSDLRLLQSMKEIEEPFEKNQVGSSAMAYKRNPMRSERMAGLSRYVISDSLNPMLTASSQWFERTLDDSANKRIAMSEGFLAVDAILNTYLNVVSGLVVYPKVIEKHVLEELPFMATENIIMSCVKAGGDRQELHESIREHSMEAGKNVKINGKENDLIERIIKDKTFNIDEDELRKLLKPENYIGRSVQQTEEFINLYIKPILEKNTDLLDNFEILI